MTRFPDDNSGKQAAARGTTSIPHNFATGPVQGIPVPVVVAALLAPAVPFAVQHLVVRRRLEAAGAGVVRTPPQAGCAA